MKKILFLFLAFSLIGCVNPALASQHDYDVANGPGATVRADINDVLDSVATNNSGGTAPSSTFANMWWFDTATNILKQRNEANTAWISIAYKNGNDWTPYRQGSLLTVVSTSDFSSQAQAEAGTDNATVMTPLRVAQRSTATISSQAQAEAGTDNATFMTPLRVKQAIDEFDSVLELASQGEAEAGTENTKAMTALRVAQAIAELESPGTVFISGTTYEIAGSSGTVNTYITSYAKKKEVAVAYGGTLRADWEMYQSDCGTVYARIYVNGAAVGAEKSSSSGNWTAFYTEDIAVEPGDLVQLYIKATGGAEGFARNFTLSSTVPEVSTVNL